MESKHTPGPGMLMFVRVRLVNGKAFWADRDRTPENCTFATFRERRNDGSDANVNGTRDHVIQRALIKSAAPALMDKHTGKLRVAPAIARAEGGR